VTYNGAEGFKLTASGDVIRKLEILIHSCSHGATGVCLGRCMGIGSDTGSLKGG